jgi:nucleotide-binding universal stress UspA family protein
MAQTILKERRVLLCIDESENAQRAVDYVGRIVGNLPGFQISVVSIVEEPSPDIFPRPEDRDHYLSEKQSAINEILKDARDRLIELGVDEKSVTVELHQRQCDSLAECILDEQRAIDYGTVVVGRRGLSKSEEFLFGSVSNKVVHYARDCTVWVVE